jgi:hypothetical protein
MGTTAHAAVELVLSRPPTLGGGRLLCIDGPAGSGKTTLAEQVFEAFPGSRVVHLDDLYDGWSGLPRVDRQVGSLLGPLAEGRPGSYRRFDWGADAYAETVVVDPVDLLVLEGVGAGAADPALVTALVWVEAPEAVRLSRGLARDGSVLADHWVRWQHDEAEHFAAHGTRERADLVVTT